MKGGDSMGCVYRPTYRDRHGRKRSSAIWWVAFHSSGKQIFESTKTKDQAGAKRYLKRREGEIARGKPIRKASSRSNSRLWPMMLSMTIG